MSLLINLPNLTSKYGIIQGIEKLLLSIMLFVIIQRDSGCIIVSTTMFTVRPYEFFGKFAQVYRTFQFPPARCAFSERVDKRQEGRYSPANSPRALSPHSSGSYSGYRWCLVITSRAPPQRGALNRAGGSLPAGGSEVQALPSRSSLAASP